MGSVPCPPQFNLINRIGMLIGYVAEPLQHDQDMAASMAAWLETAPPRRRVKDGLLPRCGCRISA
jgi:hypothetical protein